MRKTDLNYLTAAVLLSLTIGACSSSNNEPADTQQSDGDANPTHLGGCILLRDAGELPADLYLSGEVTASGDIFPFSKSLDVYGLKLAARDDISDEFMQLVAQAIVEIFPQDPSLDLDMQREVLANHYRYKALIPVPLGFDYSFMENNPEQWSNLEARFSICDVIMQDVPEGQVMEVLEHILHYVSDIGLHYAYPEVWGIHPESMLARAMKIAVDDGHYDVSGYDDIDQPDIRFRVEMQEFAYWFISSAWDLQEAYGPKNEREWMLPKPTDLQEHLPELYAAYEETVARVMVSPSLETLRQFGPTRAEEAAK